ncbi:MAG: HI0074 family nucleotidyltransferase substrate-binding subunit [Bacteroidota bacterium]|jgi:nucleotidyltransferase substrate binding protein (TIGR01987 family)
MTKLEASVSQFRSAVRRLEEALALPKSEIVRDSAILRFEIALDLAWKVLKNYLEAVHGVVCLSPKGCFRDAFRLGILEYEDRWLTLIDLRNQTAHTYNEQLAEEIYRELVSAPDLFQALLQKVAM